MSGHVSTVVPPGAWISTYTFLKVCMEYENIQEVPSLTLIFHPMPDLTTVQYQLRGEIVRWAQRRCNFSCYFFGLVSASLISPPPGQDLDTLPLLAQVFLQILAMASFVIA